MKNIGITSVAFGLLGIGGALDTGNGWTASISLFLGGLCFIGIYFLERRMDEKEDNNIAAQYLVTFYKSDKPCGNSKK